MDQYTPMPCGLATGVQVLTRLLDHVFQDIKFDFVYRYLDDVVTNSKTLKHISSTFVLCWIASERRG